ncbi:unnamed protein product [Closterium sp. Naga37s-1]|nr:unnamed protein product [Closterium sp. Naga37s-1]
MLRVTQCICILPLSSLEIVSATNLPVLFVCNSASTRGVVFPGMGEKQGMAAAHAAREGIGVRWTVVRDKLGRLQQERMGEGQEEEKVRGEEGQVELGEVDRRIILSKGGVAAKDMSRVREGGFARSGSKGRVQGVGRGQELRTDGLRIEGARREGLGTEGVGIEGAWREGAGGAAAERNQGHVSHVNVEASQKHPPTPPSPSLKQLWEWFLKSTRANFAGLQIQRHLWERFLKSTRGDFAGLQRHVVDMGVQMEQLREENQRLRDALQQQQSAQVLAVWEGVGEEEEEAQGREEVQRELWEENNQLRASHASEACADSEAPQEALLGGSSDLNPSEASEASEALKASEASEALRASEASEALRASEASATSAASEALNVGQRTLVEENRELRERVEERERAVRAAQSTADALASELAAAQSQLSAAQQQAQGEREGRQRLAGELASMQALLLQQMQAVAEQKELIERLLERQQQQADVLEPGGPGTVGPGVMGSEPVGSGAGESGAGELGTGESGAGELGTGESGAGELAAGESGAGELAAGESGAGELAAGESGAGESGAGESEEGELRAGESRAGESGVGESGAGESGAEELGAGELGAGRSGAGESGAGELGAGELGAGESGAGESGAGESGAGGSQVVESEVVGSPRGNSEAVGLGTEVEDCESRSKGDGDGRKRKDKKEKRERKERKEREKQERKEREKQERKESKERENREEREKGDDREEREDREEMDEREGREQEQTDCLDREGARRANLEGVLRSADGKDEGDRCTESCGADCGEGERSRGGAGEAASAVGRREGEHRDPRDNEVRSIREGRAVGDVAGGGRDGEASDNCKRVNGPAIAK